MPLYNAFVWVVKSVFSNVFLDSLLSNLPSISRFASGLAGLCRHTALEIPPFVSSLAIPCDYSKLGDLCYVPGGYSGRIIDGVTAMQHVRTMASAASKIGSDMCGPAAALVHMALFPLMDINLAKAVHNILNSITYAAFQVPSVTALRCSRHGPASSSSSSAGILMCMPDLNEPINMFVAGLRNLGVAIDNWLDVSSIIAQRSLHLLSEEQAAAIDCESNAKSLTPAFYSKQLFSNPNRPKIVVGLTTGLYAVTDGLNAQYFNHYDGVESLAASNVWPIEIDTRFGVAAVTYGGGALEDRDQSTGESATTMLGCRWDLFLAEGNCFAAARAHFC